MYFMFFGGFFGGGFLGAGVCGVLGGCGYAYPPPPKKKTPPPPLVWWGLYPIFFEIGIFEKVTPVDSASGCPYICWILRETRWDRSSTSVF